MNTLARSMTVVAVAVTVIAGGCTDGAGAKLQPTATHAEAPSSVTPGPAPAKPHPWPADTPPATACTAHDECVVVPVAPGDDPCCDVTLTIAPRSVRYLEFVADHRAKHCAGVECPPLSLPGAQPAACGSVGRCLRGQCDIGCNDPAYMAAGGDRPDGPPPPGAEGCVADCVARRQMQAIAADAIEANCRQDCAAGTAPR